MEKKKRTWTIILLLGLGWVVMFICCGFGLKMLNPTASDQLATIRNDPSPEKRRTALLNIPADAPGASDAIIQALGDSDSQVRRAALARIRAAKLVSAAVPVLIERAQIDAPDPLLFSLLASARDSRAVEPMIALLQDEQRCDYAAEVLGETGDQRAAEPLHDAMQTARRSGKPVPKKGLVALGKLRDARAFDLLVELLPNPDYKQSAIEGLGWLGDARGIPHLVGLLREHAATIVPALDRLDPQWKTKSPGLEFVYAQLEKLKTLVDINSPQSIFIELGPSVHPQILAILQDPHATPIGQLEAARLLLNCRVQEWEDAARRRLINFVSDVNLDQAVRFAAVPELESKYPKDDEVNGAIFALARELIASRTTDDRIYGGTLLARLHNRGYAAAQKELDQSWQRKDFPPVLGAWFYHRKRRGDDAIPVLLQAFSEYGTGTIAQEFVNSGNKQLDAAGAKWAAEHGFILIQRKL